MSARRRDRRRLPIGAVYFWLMVFFLYLPLALLVLLSFNDSISLSFPLEGFTLEWYDKVIHNEIMMEALRNSALMSVVSSLAATLLGTMGAIAVAWYRFPGRNFFLGLATAPLVIPYVIVGVALLVALNWMGVPLSLWTVGLGEMVINLPLAMLIVLGAVIGFDQSLGEASMDLGAGYWKTQLLVTLPIIAPSLVAAFITCIVAAFNELAMAFFLIGAEPIIPTYLFSQLRNTTSGPIVMAAASLIILISFILVILATIIEPAGQRKSKKPAKASA